MKKQNSFQIYKTIVLGLVILLIAIFLGYGVYNDKSSGHFSFGISEAMAKKATYNNVYYGEDNITVGACKLSVYTAFNMNQKIKGMLGFNDRTFKKDGMIFIGSTFSVQYYHTMGMKMDIMIMGLNKIGDNEYKVVGKPILAKPGIELIKLKGESILEIPARLYNTDMDKCLLSRKNSKK